jgi:hypothetical protein
MDGSWPHRTSPFHRGEQAVQTRVGVRDKTEDFGRRVIRDHLPDQHREFYRGLAFVLAGTGDADGRPWASILTGRPGFVSSPDSHHLHIAARPLAGDPLRDTLRNGLPIGLLGIDLGTRRRNRLTGKVSNVGADGFSIAVDQTFGNCPQYIQTRTIVADANPGERPGGRPAPRRHDGNRFDDWARALIRRSDTFFIATQVTGDSDDPASGADVSHRGGRPGFVHVEDDGLLVFPDFSGNLHFNTLGNIVLNPRAGLLFIDFESGDVLYLTGGAEIVWEGDDVRAFAGAERLVRFRAQAMIRVEGSLPLRFRFGEMSPSLEATGSWEQAFDRIAADRQRDTYIRYTVHAVARESDTVTSFTLRRADGRAVAGYQPGQFLPIRLALPGTSAPVTRTYTVSDAPAADADVYRLSIKRQEGGAVSAYFHQHVQAGFELEAMAPRGTFLLDTASERPVALISAGIGITPMMAMANHLINEGRRTRAFRRLFFIHGTTNGRTLAFGRHLRARARVHPDAMTVHIRFSRPDAADRLGDSHDSVGRVDMDLLKTVLPFDDYDFYLCGPAGFMQALYDGLTGLGVRDARIRYESFGPATVLKREAAAAPDPPGAIADGPVAVRFARSAVDAQWSPSRGTLLELAEAAGLSPAFGCRSGVCGTCATRITCGTVDYVDTPVAPRGEGEVLICRATPRSTSGAATCGDRQGVVLDL